MTTLRTASPSYENKYYKHVNYGGVNECLRISGSQCLPNCVGYAWGAWYEMMGKRPNLSRGNAKNWYGYTSDGYTRSKTAELGAVACWGGSGYGHVAIVVGIHSDHITVAQSNYGGNRFEVVNCYKMSNGLYKSHGGNTNMQGFILLPNEYKISTGNATTSNETGIVKTFHYSKMSKGKTFVTKCALNMRDYPSTKSGKVKKTISANSKLYYYGYGAYNGNIVWYWVTDGTTEGYVYGGVLNSGTAPYLKNANP